MFCYSGLIHLSFLSSEKTPVEEEEAPVEAPAEETEEGEAEGEGEEPTEDAEVILYSQLRAVRFIFSINF